MLIYTIATEDWAGAPLGRWLRHVKASNPGMDTGLILISDRDMRGDGVVGGFDKVATYGVKEGWNRRFWNAVRMLGPDLWGESECIYCDCDADVVGGLGWLDGVDTELGYVRSPAMHGWWAGSCEGRGEPVWEANNGFLLLRKNWIAEYKAAEQVAMGMGAPERIGGTVAFNVMLRAVGKWRELPYKTSVIWWDIEHLIGADVIQWCNDKGQARRAELERLWGEVNGRDRQLTERKET